MLRTEEYVMVCGNAFEDMSHDEMLEFDGGTTPTVVSFIVTNIATMYTVALTCLALGTKK